MNIGSYTFAEFKARAAEFHGYPAPGLLIGAYMVEKAKQALPAGTLFEALVETSKCLPDSVQMLTLCSTGNSWMKVMNLGRIALSLYDKHTGIGYRVFIDLDKLDPYPEIRSWLLKIRPKREQDTEALFRQIEEAGDTIFGIEPVQMDSDLLGHSHMGPIAVCPKCKEPYPTSDGDACLACQGHAPYTRLNG